MSPKPKDKELTATLAEGYQHLAGITAQCPVCDGTMMATSFEIDTADDGEEHIFTFVCESEKDEDAELCSFYASVARKDGKWRLLACGYDYEADEESLEYVLED